MSHLDQIREWAEAQENLDVYQVNALYVGTGQRRYYCMSYWKTIACFGLQTFGIIALMLIQFDDAGGFESCEADLSTPLPWMAFFFASFVSITVSEQLRSLGEYGMYQWGSQQPAFVSRLWVGIGLWTNIVVLCMSWLCSVVIIYVSPDLSEMVLNAVAVLFMITLDDEMVTFSDYNNIRNIFVSYNSPSNVATKTLDMIGNCMLKLQCLWTFKGGIILQIILTPVVIFLPFALLFCYVDRTMLATTPAPR